MALVQPAYAQSGASHCATGGAVADAENNPGLVADCEALLDARDTLAGTATLNWSASSPMAQWVGVTMVGSPTRVTSLVFVNAGLTGTMPAALGRLSGLRVLELIGNQLTGEIPAELGGLSQLESLWLPANQLTGNIPPELGELAVLWSLQIAGNQLSGGIPPELGNLENLHNLYLSGNQLTGEIPPELGGLESLERLYLGSNRLTGEIPAELGDLETLQQLELRDNQLTGEIPKELGDLDNLQTLSLHSNRLTGEIPSELGGLASLDQLSLSGNQLTGEIPQEFGDLSALRGLRLAGNQLTGEIPEEFGGLTNLEELDLSGNQFTGEIPEELVNLRSLYFLRLSGNELTRCIPGKLREVADSDLGDLGLPFCDVLLSGLTINPGSLIQPFEPYQTEYTVAVGQSRITLATANDHNASFLFLDENDVAVSDADGATPGTQVDFSADLPLVRIRVVSVDGQANHTYTIADLGIRYDANEDGMIDRGEVIEAIKDYFADKITRDETVALIKLYFSN